jgi:CDP-6-deoxy-D-xylo-4-hexulose-3-dehydrase
MKYIKKIINRRSRNFWRWHEVAKSNSKLESLDISHMSFVSNFAFPIIGKDQETALKYKKKFIESGVEIRPIVGGSMVEQPFFKECDLSRNVHGCPNAKRAHKYGFYFPNNADLTENEVDRLMQLLE